MVRIIKVWVICIMVICFVKEFKRDKYEDYVILINDVKIDPLLLPLMEDFLEEGYSRGYNFLSEELNKKLNIIKIGELGPETVGAYYGITRTIIIDKSQLNNKNKLKALFFHEMGHVLSNKMNGGHYCEQCPHIMSMNNKYDDLIANNDFVWKLAVNDYYKWFEEDFNNYKIIKRYDTNR